MTTVSVTHAAEIVQSAFYKHFTNLEECLAIALGACPRIKAFQNKDLRNTATKLSAWFKAG